MVETTRAHDRLEPRDLPGTHLDVDTGLDRPVRVFVPPVTAGDTVPLLIHFHGAAWLVEQAAFASPRRYAVATVHLAGGSGTYDAAFRDPPVLDSLLSRVAARVWDRTGAHIGTDKLPLTAFSAGHGAIRAVLRDPTHFAAVDAVLLLDGLHTGYRPPRTVLHDGGTLASTNLASVRAFAEQAVAGRKRLLITHSAIFPGTFASTTETTDHLLDALGLQRRPVLRWGPVGMQQLSMVRAGGLLVLGFAGNTAPDHVDHFHGMPRFLRLLDTLH